MSNSLKEAALKNPTLLGDPTSIKSETREIPNPDDDANSVSSPSSSDKAKGKAATDITKPQDTYASSHAPVQAPAPTEDDDVNSTPSSTSSGKAKGKASTDITKPQTTYASSHAPVMAPAPTEADTPSSSLSPSTTTNSEPTLKQRAEQKLKENPTALGDPVSIKAETSHSVPTKNEGGASDQEARRQERWKRVSKI